MRAETNKRKIREFMSALGSGVRGEGRIYLTGGATAVIEGWREMTIDVDIKADPEPSGLFEAIAILKDAIDINVELASPEDFIPAVPGWRDRSLFIARHGALDFYHYDPYSQALSKLERGHGRDLGDVKNMEERGLIRRDRLWKHFLVIEPMLMRYPAIEPGAFRTAVERFCAGLDS